MQKETLILLVTLIALFVSLFMFFLYLLKKAKHEDEEDNNRVAAMTDEELRAIVSNQTVEKRHPNFLAQVEAEANKRGIALPEPKRTPAQEREDLENARANILIASVLALAISIGHPLLVLFSSGRIAPSSMFTSALYVGLCVGVFLKSRIAAILLLVLFGANLLFTLAITNQQISWLSLFFLLSFIYAVTATFTYHGQKKKLEEIADGPSIQ